MLTMLSVFQVQNTGKNCLWTGNLFFNNFKRVWLSVSWTLHTTALSSSYTEKVIYSLSVPSLKQGIIHHVCHPAEMFSRDGEILEQGSCGSYFYNLIS